VATDVASQPLATATAVGADRTIDISHEPDALAPYAADKGTFDVMFEASGSQKALAPAFDVLKPRAVVVQVGLGGSVDLPMNTLVAKELDLRGTFRFHEEFELAVDLISRGLIDVTTLLTATLPFEQAVEAFELASDRSRAMKVQLAFS